ncbi:MAG: hypothetical protein HOG89_03260 [Candidatus Peribacter sp.]|jgi:hypothetical protein|nr:hypothetical protein [Candidatus Peribacter sp.]MBT4393189.1 hypothetical protein [Candidatus Peribacter sp.]MBT4600467.1 hypothetical protein [Candidatus Peribacter sp.]MBT5148557.1 hypothetical protein [Candidatus Peribacter sp.]MBT5638723.1 hypothetical protein [Candidatus Peribacter sp.]
MNTEKPTEGSPEDEQHPLPLSGSDSDLDAIFASGKIDDILKEAKLPTPPAKLPNVAAVQKHKAEQKRIPPEHVSNKPKKVRVQTRRPKGGSR